MSRPSEAGDAKPRVLALLRDAFLDATSGSQDSRALERGIGVSAAGASLTEVGTMRARAAFQIGVVATVMAACNRDLPVNPSHDALLASAQGPDAEPNNTCSIAQNFGAVGLPFTLDGSLDGAPLPGGDVDFLRFTGTPN